MAKQKTAPTRRHPVITESNIGDLVPDDRNFNKHSEYGMHLLEKSLSKFGAGRSILLDKNNRIIAGNGIVETAGNIGMENVIIVESDGHSIIAVKRNDIDLDTAQGREMALADNATGKANLQWDDEMILDTVQDFEIDPTDWGVDPQAQTDEIGDIVELDKFSNTFNINIKCESPEEVEEMKVKLGITANQISAADLKFLLA